jgi:hypothetical protein
MRLLAMLALFSVPFGMFALAPSAISAISMLVIFLAVGYTIATVAITMGTVALPGELRGLYLGLMLTLGALCFIGAAPSIVSMLSTALGGEAKIGVALAAVCAGASVAGAAIFAIGTRRYPENAESMA